MEQMIAMMNDKNLIRSYFSNNRVTKKELANELKLHPAYIGYYLNKRPNIIEKNAKKRFNLVNLTPLKFKKFRRANSLTQREIARILNVYQCDISFYENNMHGKVESRFNKYIERKRGKS